MPAGVNLEYYLSQPEATLVSERDVQEAGQKLTEMFSGKSGRIPAEA